MVFVLGYGITYQISAKYLKSDKVNESNDSMESLFSESHYEQLSVVVSFLPRIF
jgi:hypothetical protein